MHNDDRTFEMDAFFDGDRDFRSYFTNNEEDINQEHHRIMEKNPFPFSRKVIARLIDWFERA